MAGAERITADTTVDEVVTRVPASARAFITRRMACVGCDLSRFETLADACRIYDQPIDDLLEELRAITRRFKTTQRGEEHV